MASRFKTMPVGSSQWIQNERDQATEFVDMEVEEFGYAAQNEMEWLNEHMAEIFSSNPVFADVFKTPGKLRGKTPRTARKNAARAPLTDLFAPNPQSTFSPAPKNDFYAKVAQFQIAQDAQEERPRQGTSRRSPLRVGKENTDSGYHGMTEDEMDVDSQQSMIKNSHAQPPAPELEPLPEHVPNEPAAVKDTESFVSANGDAEKAENVADDDQATVPDTEASSRPVSRDSNAAASFANENDENWQADEDQGDKDMDEDEDLDEDDTAKSPSDTSTPDKPLVRKSSLTFAALPAREPLTAKRSIGQRSSHLDVLGGARSSVLGKSLGITQQTNSQPAEDAEEHNKTSTQRLHERITQLGQQKEPRTSKSIPMPLASQPGYPALPSQDKSLNETDDHQHLGGDTQPLEDDDDDWIAPIRTNSRPASGVDTEKPADAPSDPVEVAPAVSTEVPRPALRESPSKYFMGHQKSSSTTTLASPAKVATVVHHAHHTKNASVSNPNFTPASGAVTPLGSPATKHRFADAPLSASKAKLYSVLKSAKGMFGSSAAASAQAKMDSNLSPRPLSAATFERPDPDMSKIPGGLYPDLTQIRPATALALTGEGRKTRSSTENARKKDKEAKEDQSVMDGLEKIREKERQKAAEQKQEREKAAETSRLEKERLVMASRAGAESQQSWRSTADEASEADEPGPPVPPKNSLPAGKLRAPGRLAKPTRLAGAQSKPAPVNIKVASNSQRVGSTQPAGSSQDANSAPTTTRQQASKSGSAQPPASTKSGPASSARVRALEAAARKKEQDDKAAQRKAEQKREIERKRATKAEEERKAEQERKEAEQKRLQEIRAAAQKQAEQRKLEQQRQAAAQQKKQTELAAALEQEKQATLPRGDIGGTLRQLAKQERPAPQPNTAKPAKRPLQQDADESTSRPTLPRGPPSYQQQQDNKRRKTLEGDDDQADEPSAGMTAPPKRPSNMRKESTLSKFPHGYTHAPPPAAHHAQNMFKATVTAQHHAQHAKAGMHPNDMMKLSTARIPFAENSNPSGASQAGPSSSKTPGPAFKTPGRPAAQVVSKKSVAKSSPMYPNGDNINLPEIATDSEDEDSDDDQTGGFRAPSWVASPALRDLLTQQQLVDPESIFGPIAPLQMDEVFRNSKNPDRLKKFRDRGSSARWVETGDAVTKEEKVKDREMRARVVKEGGWRYGQDA